MAVAQHLPRGRHQAGDRHLKFHEDRDNLLGAAAFDSSAPAATIDFRRAGAFNYRDHLAARYFRGRFEGQFGDGLRSLLLLIEGDLNTARILIPNTALGHEQSAFRARTITLYHALTALQRIAERYASLDTAGLRALRAILREPPTMRLVGREGRCVRNRCMHYKITNPAIHVDAARPMFGLVEAVYPGNTWEGFNADVINVTSRVADCLDNWRP